ncbi:sensor histidine kinase [Rheinheimera baltica]|uniref:sensor histidine kinase n=1 Tax=Rheinheimera baltica TaxID=67576 RepID=UPI00273E5516|nr:sensor histidine kinase [Rheinheimera baltica]MDP5149002.1 ATP-binding protein [Rheinheimera baltica]
MLYQIIKIVFFVTLSALLILTPHSKAWAERFSRLGVDDGLPNATIYSVQQDKTGYLWLGSTNSGLLRYDGYRFVEFPLLTNEELVNHQTPDVGVVLIDDDDAIWAGTWGMGLSRLDAKTSKLSRFTEAKGLAGNQIQALLKDNSGRVWVGTTAGLSRIETDDSISHIGRDPLYPVLADQRIWSLTKTTDGAIWIGTSAGLHRWHDDVGLSPVIELVPGADNLSRSNEIRVIKNINNQLWVGSRIGLFRYETEQQRFVALPLMAAGLSEPVLNVITGGDAQNTLLIGSYNGLFRINLGGETPLVTQSLSHVNIRSILTDRSGVLWLGSREGGLYRNIVSSNAFTDISSISASLAQQDGFSVTAILKHNGQMWLGGAETLYQITLDDGQFTQYNVGSRVNAVVAGALNQIYVATDNGLLLYHPDTGIKNLSEPFDLAGVANRNVRDLKIDDSGRLYLGMWGEGVIAWQPEQHAVQHWLTQLSETSVGNAVQQLFVGENNQLWVATRYSGVYQINLATGEMQQFSALPDSKIKLVHNNVQCVSEHAALLVICSREGLVVVNQISGEQQLITTKQGLPSNNVLGVLQQGKQLWVMTAKGLGYRPTSGQRFLHYTSHDGLVSSELNTNAMFAENDTLYFGAIAGLISVKPSLLTGNNAVPQPVLSSFVIDHHIVQIKPHGKPWPLIRLAPDSHTMSFEFSALDYQDPQRNQFQYKLAGINQDWVMAGTNNSAFYANLPVGTYPLWLKVSNNHGVFSAAEIVATLQVLPHWWQQRWVIYSAMLCVALILWLLHLYRLRHIRQINRLLQSAVDDKARAQVVLETRVTERTSALEESSITLSLRTKQLERSLEEQAKTNLELKRLDKLKDEFIATVSHELRTPLTAIRGAVGLIAQNVLTPDHPAYQSMLQTAQANSERLAHLINDLLDLQKFAAGNFTLDVAHIDLDDLASQAVQAMLPYAKRYDVELTLKVNGDDTFIVNADALRLRQVIDNLTSNAIKFSPKQGTVVVRLSATEHNVKLEVEDCGSGIPEMFQQRIFEKFSQADSSDSRAKEGSGLGLAICKKIIENHYGNIGFHSVKDQGSIFWFTLQRIGNGPKP